MSSVVCKQLFASKTFPSTCPLARVCFACCSCHACCVHHLNLICAVRMGVPACDRSHDGVDPTGDPEEACTGERRRGADEGGGGGTRHPLTYLTYFLERSCKGPSRNFLLKKS